jgi:hypothetical protein
LIVEKQVEERKGRKIRHDGKLSGSGGKGVFMEENIKYKANKKSALVNRSPLPATFAA